jgi:predicted MFS family arabinose efflux permease
MTNIEQWSARWTGSAKLLVLAAALFVVGTNAFIVAGLLPQVALGVKATTAQVGYTVTLYGIIVAVVSPVLATVLSQLPRHLLMASGLVVIILGVCVTACASTITVFIVGRVVAAVGGAALVPAATALAPRLLPVEQRGRALTVVGLGFTLATALGAPAGTALAGVSTWRVPLFVLACIAALLLVPTVIGLRGFGADAALPIRARVAVLSNRRVIAALLSTVALCLSFNIVYFFSSAVSLPATRGSAQLLAALLLAYGIGGFVGTSIAGLMTDRFGSSMVFFTSIASEVVVFAVLAVAGGSMPIDLVLFALWGVVGFGAGIPLQHLLVGIDPQNAGVVLSWYNTGLYIAIALSPIIGGPIAAHHAQALPLVGAAAALVAGVAFVAAAAHGPSAEPSTTTESTLR